jgi:hypothetical protein
VILDNLVKIFKNVGGSCHEQPPAGKQQQISQEQHRGFSLSADPTHSLLLLRRFDRSFDIVQFCRDTAKSPLNG